MRKLILAAFLMFGSSFALAEGTTDLTTTKWLCTTNASSSDLDADKAADDQMANTAAVAAESFAFATKNCRDCTKITCEAQK